MKTKFNSFYGIIIIVCILISCNGSHKDKKCIKDKRIITVKEGEQFTDERDGKSYKTVWIDDQLWMAENLNYSEGINSFCTDKKFGRLYDFQTALSICPKGWHLPTLEEWEALITYLGGYEVAGGRLKAISHWKTPNMCATNESGFTALPAGEVSGNASTYNLGTGAMFWSSSYRKNGLVIEPYAFLLYNDNQDIFKYNNDKLFNDRYYSIRCIKDK